MNRHEWKDEAACRGYDTNLFFDKYEDDPSLRKAVDSICSGCPVAKQCFAVGVSQKEWGVWGGIYLENGKISREFSRHRSKPEWAETWQYLTMDKG
jgi:hypothetical protein